MTPPEPTVPPRYRYLELPESYPEAKVWPSYLVTVIRAILPTHTSWTQFGTRLIHI